MCNGSILLTQFKTKFENDVFFNACIEFELTFFVSIVLPVKW